MSKPDAQVDVIIVGSGIGGLCCGALLARYGFEVLVCESHSIAGGAAHGFERGGFEFDSGPSLYSGLSDPASPNPLRHVLNAIAEEPEWIQYDTWGCCLPEGDFPTRVGGEQFIQVLERLSGAEAVEEWRSLQQVMQPLGEAAIAMPPAALRFDLGAIQTVLPYAGKLLKQTKQVGQLTGPFSKIMDGVVRDPFARNWLDMLCFLLSGLPADGTISAAVAFMFADWYRPGVKLDFPVGGSKGLVDALVRGIEKKGGEVRLRSHVEEILIEGGRAIGVRLRGGAVMQARKAVISNASVWDTMNLLPEDAVPCKWRQQREQTPACESFMHLHVGIDATGLDLECHYIVVNDWARGVAAAQNLSLISIPSVLDPHMAPKGKHGIHVYTPGNEPYAPWSGMDRRSAAYQDLKAERSQVMWQALRRVIPDIDRRVELSLVGTPLTHERFLRRDRGSYGPAIAAGKGIFPGPKTPLPGLICCGDSTFPGIGLPAVAASGMIAANTLATVKQHQEMLRDAVRYF
ncbi:NAD(P)/FAD-dependent oxidoreductase [filamentous cyanobacterium LEGE 11480]|uniref:NAD(P)/FAD-dependent oxidoreductase n=1 Tax=Romeriopsis navalis LEGE 11480 TaxID=2777977 RepID=A0A928VMF1_9CYAN|nr:NAD(P)/FAD-dependent oxidoreductase [Romeriopsis navalis]MBE9031005.1 NAD(P)/FAD-dependent oxidoreductase [Romeriopsis navalis LEGE 11480]